MRYCNWTQEFPRYQACRNFAVEGTYRCEEHPTKKRTRSGGLTTAQKEAVRRDYDYKCARCGAEAHEVNHIVPLVDFEEHEKHLANMRSNLEVLCFYHHSAETTDQRKERIDVGDPNDRSTSARNRKKKRRRSEGFYL